MWPFKRKRDVVKVVKPLPRRIEETVAKLELIKSRLGNRVKTLEWRSKELFEHVVKAHIERDSERAKLYANELAELRKTLRKVVRSELALEGVIHRLQTAKDLDELSDALAPIRETLIYVGRDIGRVAPELSENLRSLTDVFDEFSIQVGVMPEMGYIAPTLSEDAQKILEEASAVAAQRSKSSLSEPPL